MNYNTDPKDKDEDIDEEPPDKEEKEEVDVGEVIGMVVDAVVSTIFFF